MSKRTTRFFKLPKVVRDHFVGERHTVGYRNLCCPQSPRNRKHISFTSNNLRPAFAPNRAKSAVASWRCFPYLRATVTLVVQTN